MLQDRIVCETLPQVKLMSEDKISSTAIIRAEESFPLENYSSLPAVLGSTFVYSILTRLVFIRGNNHPMFAQQVDHFSQRQPDDI